MHYAVTESLKGVLVFWSPVFVCVQFVKDLSFQGSLTPTLVRVGLVRRRGGGLKLPHRPPGMGSPSTLPLAPHPHPVPQATAPPATKANA